MVLFHPQKLALVEDVRLTVPLYTVENRSDSDD
jgi:hypothetical protein